MTTALIFAALFVGLLILAGLYGLCASLIGRVVQWVRAPAGQEREHERESQLREAEATLADIRAIQAEMQAQHGNRSVRLPG